MFTEFITIQLPLIDFHHSISAYDLYLNHIIDEIVEFLPRQYRHTVLLP